MLQNLHNSDDFHNFVDIEIVSSMFRKSNTSQQMSLFCSSKTICRSDKDTLLNRGADTESLIATNIKTGEVVQATCVEIPKIGFKRWRISLNDVKQSYLRKIRLATSCKWGFEYAHL